jgi:hypothetical protein
MHNQRIAAFLLGAWILGSLFMIFVATQNFKMADTLGNTETHATLRDMAGRLNQVFFVTWERAELVLGVAVAAILWFGIGSRGLAGLSMAPLALVAIQHFLVTPRMLALSAHLDAAADASQFAKLHAMYGISEVIKLVLVVALAVVLLPSWRRAADSREGVQPSGYARQEKFVH